MKPNKACSKQTKEKNLFHKEGTHKKHYYLKFRDPKFVTATFCTTGWLFLPAAGGCQNWEVEKVDGWYYLRLEEKVGKRRRIREYTYETPIYPSESRWNVSPSVTLWKTLTTMNWTQFSEHFVISSIIIMCYTVLKLICYLSIQSLQGKVPTNAWWYPINASWIELPCA